MKQGNSKILLMFRLRMGDGQVLKDIEYFEEAYYSRWEDFKAVKKANRKIICMHLGGIIIECLLKSYIIKKYNIKKVKGINYWYSEEKVKEIEKLTNVIKNTYKKKKTVDNPGHNLKNALKQLDELNNAIPNSMMEKLEFIFNPLEDYNSFIDLRYSPENYIADDEFDKWLNDFIELRKWFEQHQHIIKEVSVGDE